MYHTQSYIAVWILLNLTKFNHHKNFFASFFRCPAVGISGFFVSRDISDHTLRKIQQQRRHFRATHLDPSKFTHFNKYFDDDSASKYLFKMCQFTGITMTRFQVSFMLQNFVMARPQFTRTRKRTHVCSFKSNKIRIVITLFRLIWNKVKFPLVSN